MLTSLALIFLLGLILSSIFKRLRLPGLLGMLITGMILSPYALNLLDESILNISKDLRQIALVIILTRAGLALDIDELKKVGRPAILMSFVPAIFEIVGITLIAPLLLGISYLDAAILGTVVAAVSPAVIVPKMLKLMETGYGTNKSIPQLIMAGASVDDVFVIVLFTAFTALAKGGEISMMSFVQIPIAIVLGLIVGIICGIALEYMFRKIHIRDSAKVIIILSISFLLVTLEKAVESKIPLSGLLAVMTVGGTILNRNEKLAKRLSLKFSKIWVGAEILLFVLVGATVDIRYTVAAGVIAIVVIIVALIFRLTGVYISLLKTNLERKERIFCMFAYMPKATVQAAIGTIPLSMGLSSGQIILTVAVLAILITAPLGDFLLELTYKKWLTKED